MPRERDPIWDAVCEVAGIDSTQVTRSGAGDIGKTVKELKEVGATPEEIHKRAREWKSRYEGATFTHRVLRLHWAELVPPPPRYSERSGEGFEHPGAVFDAEVEPTMTPEERQANIEKLNEMMGVTTMREIPDDPAE